MQDSFRHIDALNPGGLREREQAIVRPTAGHRNRHVLSFSTIFLLLSISGLIYCFARAPVFSGVAPFILPGAWITNILLPKEIRITEPSKAAVYIAASLLGICRRESHPEPGGSPDEIDSIHALIRE